MQYYAVHREAPDKELAHFKYIKKKKINGKWRYYYDRSELDKYDKNAVEVTKRAEKDGSVYMNTTEYKKTNKLLGEKRQQNKITTGSIAGNRIKTESREITKTQGKLDRGVAKGEKWVYNTFLGGSSDVGKAKRKKKSTSNIKKTAARQTKALMARKTARKAVNKFLNGLSNR